MIRHLAIATLAAAALSGCVSDYAYRDGPGDYYYGRPSVEYYEYGYGAPYGSAYGYPGWSGSLYYGRGYPYGYYGYGYPYGYYGGYYPYWHHHHHNHRPPQDDRPGPVTGGRLPPVRYGGPNPPLQAPARPQQGAGPLRPPVAGGAWRGNDGVGTVPSMSRPAPRMVREPQGGAPLVAPRRSAPPRMAPPSRPAPRSNFPERERVREREQ